MKRIFKKIILTASVIMLFAVLSCFGAGALSETGWCGDDVYWNYDSYSGYLSISGKGTMWDYKSDWETPFRNSEINTVTIGNGVTHIGNNAFGNCDSIYEVTISNSVKSIGAGAFNGCSIEYIKIPQSVKTIGKGAFDSCQYLGNVTISNGVTNIGENAFANCFSLTNITIPDSVKKIGDGAFNSCGLKGITVSKNNKYYSSDNYGVLFNKSKTKLIQYPVLSSRTSYTIPNSVTSIDMGAFVYGVNLKSIKIHDGVTSIGEGAFFQCQNLESITLPNGIKTIDNTTFAYCKNLTTVNIPDSVTKIGEGAFAECKKLKSITISHSVKNIGNYAFLYCENLSTVHYIGTSKQWNNINIGEENSALLSCDIHFCSTTTKKATPTANGTKSIVCSDCNYTKKQTIAKASKIALSATTGVYNGKVKTPTVTVKDSNGKALKKGTDYTVTYESGRKLPGKYVVTVTFKDNYSGTKKLTFTITPKALSKVTATQTTSAITIKWAKSAGATGYRVFRKVDGKWKVIANTTKLTYTFKKLKAGTAYDFAVRPYTVDGKDTVLATSYTQVKTATKCATPTLKVTSGKKGIANAVWTNVAGETGYELYGSSKKDSGYKKIATTKANVAKASKNKLTSKKTYYFKVRAYKTVGGQKIYSAFSAVKSVRIK